MVNKFTLFVICILAVSIKSAEPELDEGVLVLTDENFDETIAKYEHILVEFYAPWCGHCKKLAPEYAAAAGELKNDNVKLAKIDTTEHKVSGEKYKIQGFPTLKFFTRGQDMEYGGGRVKAEIVSWLRKKTGPASRTLNSVSDVEAFQKSADAVVVLFGTNNLDSYINNARNFDDIQFGHCSAPECLTHFKVEDGTVVVLKNFDEKRNDLAKGYSASEFKSFVESKTVPTIMNFDEKCAQLIFGKNIPGLFLYYDKNSQNANALVAILSEVAQQLKGKVQAIKTGITEGIETKLAEYIGVTEKDLPSIRIADTRTELKKFNMSGDITTDNILAFVADWQAGKLKAHTKSEEIPATQNEAVYVLVGKEFDRIVLDETKDVLVEFYAPWCGHCKKIAPIYEEVAEKLKHNKNLIIAKMDATANETDRVSIQGFPTIKFWPAGKKSAPMDFEGDRTVEGFTQFLTKHSTNNVSHKDDL